VTVKSVDLVDGVPAKERRPRIGLVRGAHIEGAFIVMLYGAMLALALLSAFGTFYGMRGQAAPVPWLMPFDAYAAPALFGIAVAVQVVLTLVQWGARQMARHDPRWWIVYLVALAWSVYYNGVAYLGLAVVGGVPWLVALLLIIAADAVPEWMVVKD
jgi:hypothetical protein